MNVWLFVRAVFGINLDLQGSKFHDQELNMAFPAGSGRLAQKVYEPQVMLEPFRRFF